MIFAASKGEPLSAVVELQFPDTAISWAGPGTNAEEFCFGSEDGTVFRTTVQGVEIAAYPSIAENS